MWLRNHYSSSTCTHIFAKRENSSTQLAYFTNLEVPVAFVDASSSVSLNPSLHLRMARSSFLLLGKKLSQRKRPGWSFVSFLRGTGTLDVCEESVPRNPGSQA